MNGQNSQLAASIILSVLSNVGPALAAVNAAKSEGRDLTDAELGGLFDAEQIAKAKLDAAIDG